MKTIDLLAAHMAGDYILQTDKQAVNKTKDVSVLTEHVTAYTACFVPVAFMSFKPKRALLFLVLIWITHFITDSRRWVSGANWPPKPILVDQSIHIITLAILNKWR